MSLTLNISKEAKLFYKNGQKTKERLESLHPSSTIFMKTHSSNYKNKKSPDNQKYTYESSEEEFSDVENVIKHQRSEKPRNRQLSRKKSRYMGYLSDEAPKMKKRCSIPSTERSNMFPSSHRLRCQSQKEERKQNARLIQVNELYGAKQKRKNVPQDYDIPSRDLKGNENDSDEQIPEDMSCDEETWDEPPQSQDVWHADAYRNNLMNTEGDEGSRISENNPFAKQRLLKSKYKNLYSN